MIATERQDAFSHFHPTVNLLYFALIFGFSMSGMHPACLIISLASAAGYYLLLKGARAARRLLKILLPLFLLTALLNPAFSHAGQTILCYLPTGNPLTLESIVYGAAAGLLLSAVLLWFACFSEVVTADKFVYLFGRVLPSLSLLLSMTLRFVPRFQAQFERVKEAQATLGRDMTSGALHKRLQNAVACFSVVVTWSMENAVETSDSMKSRGYGVAKRTAYSLYRFEERDKSALAFLGFCGLFLLCSSLSGALSWHYFPTIQGALTDPLTLFSQVVYLALCLMPVYLDAKEARMWKRLRSRI